MSTVKSHDNLVAAVSRSLRECLDPAPFFHRIEVEAASPTGADGHPDLIARLGLRDGGVKRVAVVASASGQPRLARAAADRLYRYCSAVPGAYGVLYAPFVSPGTAEMCRERGIGYLDLAGNCLLAFDCVYIRQQGRPNPAPERRELRSLFAPKSTRVLRVLLNHPRKRWRVQELARQAAVSLGQAHKVKERLADREWIETEPGGFFLSRPETLLGEWRRAYDLRRSRTHSLYSLEALPRLEARLGEQADRLGVTAALTGFSGATRLAPMVRYQQVHAYVGEGWEKLAESLQLKPVTSGANIILLEPYDEGVFHGSRSLSGTSVVSPIQLYLDLMSIPGRGEEAAGELLEKVIRPTW